MSVYRHRVRAEIVHPRADHYVFIPQSLVPALDERADVARGKRVAVFLTDAEHIAVLPGQHVNAIFLEYPGDIFSGHSLAFGAGLAPLHNGRRDGRYVFLERPDCLAVIQIGVGRSVFELCVDRDHPDEDGADGRNDRDFSFHHCFLSKIHAPLGQKSCLCSSSNDFLA